MRQGADIVEPMKPLLKDYDAILMANHGAVTLGKDVMDAHFKMETVEHFAKIALVAHQLGQVKTLSDGHVNELIDLRERFGIVGRPSCERSELPLAGGGEENHELVEQITQEVLKKLRS